MLKIIGGGRVGFDPKIKALSSGWYVVNFNISNKRLTKNENEKIYDDMNVTFMTKNEDEANSIQKGCIVEIGTTEKPALWQNAKNEDGKKFPRALTFNVKIIKPAAGENKPVESDPLAGINLDDLEL